MSAETHAQLASFIWSICNLLRGPYKRNEYRKVILPLTVLRRFDCLLAPTKAEVLAEHARIKTKPETVVRSLLERITGRPFYNLSRLDLARLLDDPNQLAPNLNAYINGFSKNVREIMERFAFDQQIARMIDDAEHSPSSTRQARLADTRQSLVGADQNDDHRPRIVTGRSDRQRFDVGDLHARFLPGWTRGTFRHIALRPRGSDGDKNPVDGFTPP